MGKDDGVIVCTEELIESIFKKKVLLKPIGHKELERNSVYYVPEYNVILKLFGEKLRWGREVASLNHLKGRKNICSPEMLDYGVFQEQTYWVLTRMLSGINLSNVINNLDEKQRFDVYKKIGHMHAYFHKECRVDIWGDWSEDGKIINPQKSYFLFATEKNDKQAKRIISKGYPDTKLFLLAAEKLKSLEYTINDCNVLSLCHNDFVCRNILVQNRNSELEITGIIDFERCYPSDPESDLSPIFLEIYMKKEMEYFLRGYTEICTLSNKFDKKIKYYLIAFCLEVCSWSYKVAPDYYEKSKKMIQFLINL